MNSQKISKTINLENLNDLCKGAAFLGSGGGGDVRYLKTVVSDTILNNGEIPLITVEELDRNGYVLGVEFIGAPVPKGEKNALPKNPNVKAVLDFAQKDLGKKIQALIPVEVGGANCLTPMCAANLLKIPILDADLLGRAFPEIQMVSSNLFGVIPQKVYISDPLGNNLEILHCNSYAEIESQARSRAIKYGSHAAIMVSAILNFEQTKKVLITGTISRAINIGSQRTLPDLLRAVNGNVSGIGEVVDIDYKLLGGFLCGKITIKSEGDFFNIFVKNEYLSLQKNGSVLANCPDIITLLNKNSLDPIQSDQISIGNEVVIFTCKGPDIWYSQKGLNLVSPPLTIF